MAHPLSGWVGFKAVVGEVLATSLGVSTTIDDFTPVGEGVAAVNDVLGS